MKLNGNSIIIQQINGITNNHFNTSYQQFTSLLRVTNYALIHAAAVNARTKDDADTPRHTTNPFLL
jgi:hypothetical protein